MSTSLYETHGRDAADATGTISFARVNKSYPDPDGPVQALNDVSLEIHGNEFFTLLGPSGCGKTTLLRLVAGFEQPSYGDVRIDGQSILTAPPHQRPVNTVFQNYALFPHMTVAENVDFGQRMRDVPESDRRARTQDMLDLVHLGQVGGRRPDQLSGGQQQRVALARALANRPKVLLLDEPLSALDYKLRKDMRLELKRLQRETGITFVFVTHDQEEALEMSDRLAVMSQGEVQQVDAPSVVYERPANRFVAEFIGEATFLAATSESADGSETVCRISPDVRITATGRAARGRAVTLAVRPEHAILHTGEPDQDSLAVTIKDAIYHGSHTTYHARTHDGCPVVGRAAPDGPGFGPGDAAVLRVRPGLARLVE